MVSGSPEAGGEPGVAPLWHRSPWVLLLLSFEADACQMVAQNGRARRSETERGRAMVTGPIVPLGTIGSRGRFCRILKSALSKVSFAYFGGKPERCAYMAFEPDSAQLLSRLPTHLTTDLFAGANPVKLAADQVLFLAGDPGDSCYRVELGLLKVTMVSRSGIERILSFIGRGGIVGELAILDGLPRSASVVAVRDTALSRLTRAEFDAFAERHLELYKSMITLLTQRYARPTWRSLLGASCRCEVALPSRCSNWRIILGEMSDRTASSLSTKSGRATSRPWPELLAKT